MMNEIPIVESGFQFLARLTNRPSVRDLDNVLFPNGLTESQTVELSGNESSGKSLLLTQLIAKCILPKFHGDKFIGGLDAGVLLINNDLHIKMYRMHDIMLGILRKSDIESITQTDEIVKKSLKNLKLIHCYDNSQFTITIHTLDINLMDNENISLVIVDSINTFYWQDREQGGVWIIDEYIKNIMKVLQKHTFQSNVSLIYTKTTYSDSNAKENITLSMEPKYSDINHRIKLDRDDETEEFTCSIETLNYSKKNIKYKIDVEGIKWID